MVTPVEHASIPDDLPEFFKIFHPEICYPKLFYVKIYGKNGSLKQDVTAVKELALLPWVGENAQGKRIVVRPADQIVNRSGYLAASITSFEIVIKASHLRRARLILSSYIWQSLLEEEAATL